MRWLIAMFVVATLGSVAEARKLVVMDPPMVRACPRGKTFQAVMLCLNKQGTAKVLRDVGPGKLVKLTQSQGRWADGTLLLYVERKGEWVIGGLYQSYGQQYELLTAEVVTIGKRRGYRIEIGQLTPTSLMVDGVSPVMASMRIKRSLFCGGDSYRCVDATTWCEVDVGGRAWYAFRGTLTYEDNAVMIKGDRSRAGPNCSVPEKIYVGWTQP